MRIGSGCKLARLEAEKQAVRSGVTAKAGLQVEPHIIQKHYPAAQPVATQILVAGVWAEADESEGAPPLGSLSAEANASQGEVADAQTGPLHVLGIRKAETSRYAGKKRATPQSEVVLCLLRQHKPFKEGAKREWKREAFSLVLVTR